MDGCSARCSSGRRTALVAPWSVGSMFLQGEDGQATVASQPCLNRGALIQLLHCDGGSCNAVKLRRRRGLRKCPLSGAFAT